MSIVDQAASPQPCEPAFSALSEQPMEEGLPSALPATDSSWSHVHSAELLSTDSGTERHTLPCLQDSQPTTYPFSPLRRGPLFADTLEAPLQSSSAWYVCLLTCVWFYVLHACYIALHM